MTIMMGNTITSRDNQEVRHFAAERIVANAFLTTGYAVSRRASQYILDHALPLSLPSDWPCDLRPMRPAVCMPRIVFHPPPGCGSWIEESRAASVKKAQPDATKPLRNEIMNPRPWWFRYGYRFVTRRVSGDV